MKKLRRHINVIVTAATILILGAGTLTLNAVTPAPAEAVAASSAETAVLPAAMTDEDRYQYNKYRLQTRWLGATSAFHNQFDTFIASDLTEKMMRSTVQTSGMMAGNTSWMMTTEFLTFAVQFDLFSNHIGKSVDSAVAAIGNTLLNNAALLGTLITAFLVFVFYRAWRQRGQGRNGGVIGHMLTSMVMMTLLVVMTGAAVQGGTTTTNPDGSTTYNPTPGSPVWVVTALSNAISIAATAPAAALSNWAYENTEDLTTTTGQNGPYSCDAYVAHLNAEYQDQAKPWYSGGQGGAGVRSDVKAITDITTQLWTQTGLYAWKAAQLGTNQYSDRAYCRLLEIGAVHPSAHNTLTAKAAKEGDTTYGTSGKDSPLFRAPTSQHRDATMIAWAACVPNNSEPRGPSSFTVAGKWGTKSDGSPWISTTDCWNWWRAASVDDMPNVFAIPGSFAGIRDLTDDQEILNYVDHLHGTNLGAIAEGVWATTTYAFAALLMSGAFGLMAAAVIVSKIAVLFIVLMLFVVLIATMFLRRPSERLVPLAQKLLGVTLFAFSSSLILALVSMFVSMLAALGTILGPPGSPIYLAWVGFSPIIALFLIHYVFKKVRVPSMLTPTGAFAWGTGVGLAGAAVGSALGQRMMRGAGGMARDMAMNKIGGALRGGGRAHTGPNADRRFDMDGGQRKVTAPAHGSTGAELVGMMGTPKGEAQVYALARAEQKQRAVEEKATARGEVGGRHVAEHKPKFSLSGLFRNEPGRRAAPTTPSILTAEGRTHLLETSRERVKEIRESAKQRTAEAAARIQAAAHDATSTAAYVARAIREHPAEAAKVLGGHARAGATNAAKAAAKVVANKKVAGAAGVAAAVALGPITSVPLAIGASVYGYHRMYERKRGRQREKADLTAAYIKDKLKAEQPTPQGPVEPAAVSSAPAAPNPEPAAPAAAPSPPEPPTEADTRKNTDEL